MINDDQWLMMINVDLSGLNLFNSDPYLSREHFITLETHKCKIMATYGHSCTQTSPLMIL